MFLFHFSDFLASRHSSLHIFVVLSLLLDSYKTHFEKLSQKRKRQYLYFFVFKRRIMCTILLRRRILDQSLPFKNFGEFWRILENFVPISAIQERCHTLVFCEDAAGEKGLFLWELQRKLSSNHILKIEAGILSLFFLFFLINKTSYLQ